MPEWTGELAIEMANKNGKTVAKDVYFQGAFKVMRPVYLAGGTHPCYYLLNPGGGFLDGDTYRMDISLDERAQLTLTTQSSTKVYKTPTKEVYQESHFHLGKDSYLEYIPDALIAYENASYFQRNIFHLEQGAAFFYADILTPGWSPEGKSFSYDQLRLKNEVYLEGKLAAFDHVKLRPASQYMNEMGFMEGYTHLGSLIVVGTKTTDELLEHLHAVIQEESGHFSFGISKLTVPGFSVRIMANFTQLIERIMTLCHQIISEEWFQKQPSFLRKY